MSSLVSAVFPRTIPLRAAMWLQVAAHGQTAQGPTNVQQKTATPNVLPVQAENLELRETLTSEVIGKLKASLERAKANLQSAREALDIYPNNRQLARTQLATSIASFKQQIEQMHALLKSSLPAPVNAQIEQRQSNYPHYYSKRPKAHKLMAMIALIRSSLKGTEREAAALGRLANVYVPLGDGKEAKIQVPVKTGPGVSDFAQAIELLKLELKMSEDLFQEKAKPK